MRSKIRASYMLAVQEVVDVASTNALSRLERAAEFNSIFDDVQSAIDDLVKFANSNETSDDDYLLVKELFESIGRIPLEAPAKRSPKQRPVKSSKRRKAKR